MTRQAEKHQAIREARASRRVFLNQVNISLMEEKWNWNFLPMDTEKPAQHVDSARHVNTLWEITFFHRVQPKQTLQEKHENHIYFQECKF